MATTHPAPAISIIMIFLDAEDFIEEAIESVLAQTERNWELLLVDDGSTDSSTEIALRHADIYPGRCRYLEHACHQNRGMSASRNLGIANARGEYIAFLDADDVWLPDRLKKHLEIMRPNKQIGMVFGPTLMWYSWSSMPCGPDPAWREARDHTRKLTFEPGRPIPPPMPLIRFLETHGGSSPGICSFLARRDVVTSVGGFEENFRGLFEDQVFLSKMCYSTTVYVHHEVLDKYRQHSKSHCYQAREAGEYHPNLPNAGRRRYLLWLERYLEEQGAQDERLLTALRKELWPYRHPWISATKSYLWHQNPARLLAKRIVRYCLPPGYYAWIIRKPRRRHPATGRGS